MARAAATTKIRTGFPDSHNAAYRREIAINTKEHKDRPRQTAFTLVEILIAMLITSILVLGINTAYRQAHLIWQSAESKRPIYHNARIIFETLRQELSCLYFPQLPDQEPNHPFNLSSLPDGTAELSFYTLTPSWTTAPQSSLIAKVRYSFCKDTDTDQTLLIRTEQLCSGEKNNSKGKFKYNIKRPI